jgi:tetratricopeptide (TPR) repeat protein
VFLKVISAADVKAPEKLRTGLVCFLLTAATLAVFWRALDCDFVNYDDPTYVTSNVEVQRGLTWQGFLWALRSGAGSNWHPLTWLSHMADVSLYGLSPRGHHLTNLLLHAANAVLVLIVLTNLTGAIGRSAMVAALFALHPLRVESVVWISERKDVLSTLFWWLTLWTYACYARRGGKIAWLFSLLFFVLGLMAKPMLVTLPFVLLLLDYWPLRRLEPRRLRQTIGPLLLEKAPFFLLALASSAVTFVVQQRGGAVSPMVVLSLGARVCNVFVSYVRYLGKTFWPVHLAILYPHPRHWPAWEVAGAIVILTVISAWVLWRAARQPYLLVGWLWFLGMLVPVIGLVQVGIQSMADRYGYIPIVGVFIMVVWGAYEGLGNFAAGRWVLGTAGALALAACAVLTPRQTAYWANSETLFAHAAAVTKNNYLAYNNIGYYLSNRGEGAKAMAYYQSSLQINPNYEEAHNNLGFALAGLGSNQEAIAEYIKALSIKSDLTEAHNNLGNALGAVGRTDEAVHEYLLALQENPHHAQAHNNYGIALATHGKLDEAIEQFHMAIRDKENYASAHGDLGNVLAMQGKLNEAAEQYRICLRIDPNDPQLQNNLGNALAQQGRLDEAVEHYRTALKLRAQNPEAHFNLGYCLARQGRRAEAEEQYVQALAQRPDYAQAREQLNALREAPR